MITGCWIGTHLVEIYCNVGNLQLFLLMDKSGDLFAGRRVSRTRVIYTVIHICQVIIRIHLIRSNISLCMLSVHNNGYLKRVPKLFISLYRIDVF